MQNTRRKSSVDQSSKTIAFTIALLLLPLYYLIILLIFQSPESQQRPTLWPIE